MIQSPASLPGHSALPHARKIAFLRSGPDPRPHRVEINMAHARRQRPFVVPSSSRFSLADTHSSMTQWQTPTSCLRRRQTQWQTPTSRLRRRQEEARRLPWSGGCSGSPPKALENGSELHPSQARRRWRTSLRAGFSSGSRSELHPWQVPSAVSQMAQNDRAAFSRLADPERGRGTLPSMGLVRESARALNELSGRRGIEPAGSALAAKPRAAKFAGQFPEPLQLAGNAIEQTAVALHVVHPSLHVEVETLQDGPQVR